MLKPGTEYIDADARVIHRVTEADAADLTALIQSHVATGDALDAVEGLSREKRRLLGHALSQLGSLLISGEMPQALPIRYYHLHHAGATLASRATSTPNRIIVGLAVVDLRYEQFSRKRGREIAGGRVSCIRPGIRWRAEVDVVTAKDAWERAKDLESYYDLEGAIDALRSLFHV